MEKFKKLSPHLVVLVLFIIISFAYFSPVLKGKKLDMQDIKHWKGMSKEVFDVPIILSKTNQYLAEKEIEEIKRIEKEKEEAKKALESKKKNSHGKSK